MAREPIEAPLPGKIMDISVSLGGAIAEGDLVCTIESMKMENPILSPVGGKVAEIKVSKGQTVRGGDVLFVIER